jgi:hypothetical protein
MRYKEEIKPGHALIVDKKEIILRNNLSTQSSENLVVLNASTFHGLLTPIFTLNITIRSFGGYKCSRIITT